MGESFLVKRIGGIWAKVTDAILRVQAPTGSAVTITKDGVTKAADGIVSSDDNSAAIYHFVIPQKLFDSNNPWTISATLGIDATSDTVIVDSADEYDVVLKYYYYLYRDGAQNVSFVKRGYSNYSNGTVTFETSSIHCAYTAANTSNTSCAIGSTSTVDLTAYSTLYVEINVVKRGTSSCWNAMGLTNSATVSSDSNFVAVKSYNGANLLLGTNVYTVDISSVSTSRYVYMYLNKSSANSSVLDAYVTKIYVL